MDCCLCRCICDNLILFSYRPLSSFEMLNLSENRCKYSDFSACPQIFYRALSCKKAAFKAAFFCGKTGIRTLGTRKGTTVFETVPIDRSGIFPLVCWCGLQVQRYNLFGIVCKYFGQFFGSCCVTALYFQSDEVTEKAVCRHRERF